MVVSKHILRGIFYSKFGLHDFKVFVANCDRHKLQMTGTKSRLPDMMSGNGQIFISGAGFLAPTRDLQMPVKSNRGDLKGH